MSKIYPQHPLFRSSVNMRQVGNYIGLTSQFVASNKDTIVFSHPVRPRFGVLSEDVRQKAIEESKNGYIHEWTYNRNPSMEFLMVRDEVGNTILHNAAKKGITYNMEWLHVTAQDDHEVDIKYFINLKNHAGETPLDVARIHNKQNAIDWLVAEGGVSATLPPLTQEINTQINNEITSSTATSAELPSLNNSTVINMQGISNILEEQSSSNTQTSTEQTPQTRPRRNSSLTRSLERIRGLLGLEREENTRLREELVRERGNRFDRVETRPVNDVGTQTDNSGAGLRSNSQTSLLSTLSTISRITTSSQILPTDADHQDVMNQMLSRYENLVERRDVEIRQLKDGLAVQKAAFVGELRQTVENHQRLHQQMIEQYERLGNRQTREINDLKTGMRQQKQQFEAELAQTVRNHQRLQQELIEQYERHDTRQTNQIKTLEEALKEQRKVFGRELRQKFATYQAVQLQLMTQYERHIGTHEKAKIQQDRQIQNLRSQLEAQGGYFKEAIANHQNAQLRVITQYETQNNSYERKIRSLETQLHDRNSTIEALKELYRKNKALPNLPTGNDNSAGEGSSSNTTPRELRRRSGIAQDLFNIAAQRIEQNSRKILSKIKNIGNNNK